MDMLDTSKANGEAFTGTVQLVHAVGMHARPAVKLTKLAKRFKAHVAIRVEGAEDWINAKSVAKVMAMRAAHGSMIEIKALGEDAEAAVTALVDLVATDFPETGH
jgi:phosphocarrier protein HPr